MTAHKALEAHSKNEKEEEEEEERMGSNRGMACTKSALALMSEQAMVVKALQWPDSKCAELEKVRVMLVREWMDRRYKMRKRRCEYEYMEGRHAAAVPDLKKTKLIADMLTGVLSSLRLYCDDNENSGTGSST